MSPVDQNDLNDFYEDDQPFQPQLTPEELKTLKERKKLQALFSEANTAVNCMKIVREIEGICSELGEGFLVFAYRALLRDVLSSLMRVLDH